MSTVTQLKQKVKTISIHGKQYMEVAERVKIFRNEHPYWTITTELISLQDGLCVIKATVLDDTGRIISTGHAYEKEGSSNINKTSFIENCETSAVGRALAMFGIGIDTAIASKDEVENAQLNQEKELPKENICPICGKNTSRAALDNWGMCSDCKRKSVG